MGGDTFIYNSQLDAFTLYHISQNTPSHFSDNSGTSSGGPALPALGHALAGSLATAASKVLLYPLALVVTRLQVQRQVSGSQKTGSASKDADVEYSSLLDAARKIYEKEGGLGAFYTGCTLDVGKGIADSFLFFLAYTFLRQYELRREGTKTLSVVKELSVGIGAGSFAKLITTPIQNIVTRKQTAALVAARDGSSERTPAESDELTIKDIARQIYSERGLAGFWTGYSASVTLTLNPAITFAVDNVLKSLMPESRRQNPPPLLTFLLAASSKAIATSLTYPVMLAKSRAQATSSSKDEEADAEGTEKSSDESSSEHDAPGFLRQTAPRETSAPSSVKAKTKRTARETLHKTFLLLSTQYAIFIALRKIYRKEGLRGLYAGLDGEVLKGFLSHGLTMMMKERAHLGVIQSYYLLLRLTKRWPAELQKAQENVGAIATDAKERVENVSVTVGEGLKSVTRKQD